MNDGQTINIMLLESGNIRRILILVENEIFKKLEKILISVAYHSQVHYVKWNNFAQNLFRLVKQYIFEKLFMPGILKPIYTF